MKELIKKTKLYSEMRRARERLFLQPVLALFPDPFYLKDYLKECAKLFFNAEAGGRDAELIDREAFPDLLVFPEQKKYTVEMCSRIIDESMLLPVEKSNKLFLLSDFDTASPAVQNKLLKTLEEAQSGVAFLIGASSHRSILPTVLSRAKLIFEPPFSKEDIYEALRRNFPQGRYLKEAALSSNGCYHTAELMCADGGKAFRLAESFLSDAGASSLSEMETYSPGEIISAMRAILRDEYFSLKAKKYSFKISKGLGLPAGVLLFALQELDKMERDLNFNADFLSCLLAFSLKLKKESEKWKKLPS